MTGSLRPTEREVRGAAGGDSPARSRASVRPPTVDGAVLDRTVPLGDLLQRVGSLGAEGASAAEVLAGVCDVGDAVLMAETLLGRFARASVELEDGRWVAGHVTDQMASTSRWLERQLRSVHEGRNAIPDAAKLLELAREGRTPAELAAPFAQRWLALSRTIRRDATRVRAEAATELRALGAEASRLERLDAALRRATERATDEREHAAATAIVRRFVDGLREALRAVHEGPVVRPARGTAAAVTELVAEAVSESASETESETASESETESESESETETETETSHCETALRATDTVSDTVSDTDAVSVSDTVADAVSVSDTVADALSVSDTVADAVVTEPAAPRAPFVFDESAYVELPSLDVVRQWYAGGFVARLRRDLDALCRATLREETELLSELARGCLAAAEDEARERVASQEGEGS